MKFFITTTATLLFIIIVFTGCVKTKKTAFPDNYIAKMGGVRNWHGTDTGVVTEQIAIDSQIRRPFSSILNKTFALQISGQTVTLGIDGSLNGYGGTLLYTSSDTVRKCLVFNLNNNRYSELIYYYSADSMTFTGSYNGIHGNETIIIKTP